MAVQHLLKPLTKAEAKRADWLELRRSAICATDCSAILGVNPWKSPHDVWLEKRGQGEEKSNTAMRHGSYVEPFIASEYKLLTGIKPRKSKFYRHSKFGHFACTPDYEITIEGRRGLLECKSVGFFASKNFGSDGSDQIPEHYLLQLLWQLIVTKKEFVQLAALIDTREIRPFTYTLNPDLFSSAHVFPKDLAIRVAGECGRWWERHIVKGEEPALSGLECDREWVQRRCPNEGEITNSDELIDLDCQKLRPARKRLDRATYAKTERENRIKKFMADRGATILETTVGTFTWKTNARGVAVFKTPFTGANA